VAKQLEDFRLERDQIERNYQHANGKLALTQEQARQARLSFEYEQQVRMQV
jgi:hypothetical protein